MCWVGCTTSTQSVSQSMCWLVAKAALLLVKNLHKEYRRGRPQCLGLKRSRAADEENAVKVAIVNSSFAVEAGEIFGLLGPNGAGKSTTLNTIIAETEPTSGKVCNMHILCNMHIHYHGAMRGASTSVLGSVLVPRT